MHCLLRYREPETSKITKFRSGTSQRELERWQQTTLFRPRTGHCQLNSHVYHLRLSHTDECLIWNWCSRPRTHPTTQPNPHTRKNTPVAIWGWLPGQAVGIQGGTSNYCPVHPSRTSTSKFDMAIPAFERRRRHNVSTCFITASWLIVLNWNEIG